MRGANTLYLPYFNEETPETGDGKGRSSYLIERRDYKLMLRYYYHTWLKKRSYEETVKQLCLEFDLAERTIQDRLMMNSDRVGEIMRDKPPVFALRKQYPFYAWS